MRLGTTIAGEKQAKQDLIVSLPELVYGLFLSVCEFGGNGIGSGGDEIYNTALLQPRDDYLRSMTD